MMARSVWLSRNASEALAHWRTADPALRDRIDSLIAAICDDPDGTVGWPVRLKIARAVSDEALWSRSLRGPHRLVYKLTATRLVVHQCRYWY